LNLKLKTITFSEITIVLKLSLRLYPLISLWTLIGNIKIVNNAYDKINNRLQNFLQGRLHFEQSIIHLQDVINMEVINMF